MWKSILFVPIPSMYERCLHSICSVAVQSVIVSSLLRGIAVRKSEGRQSKHSHQRHGQSRVMHNEVEKLQALNYFPEKFAERESYEDQNFVQEQFAGEQNIERIKDTRLYTRTDPA